MIPWVIAIAAVSSHPRVLRRAKPHGKFLLLQTWLHCINSLEHVGQMEYSLTNHIREIVMVVNIYQAKSQLSALLQKAQAGEEIVIARAGKPVARLMPMMANESRSGVRFGGINSKRLNISADFHDPLADDDLLTT
jgi:prevent-host-death family protein